MVHQIRLILQLLEIHTIMKLIYLILLALILHGCSKDESEDNPMVEDNYYFPPLNSDVWDTVSMQSLNWNVSASDELYDFLSQNGTRGFILLHQGKIVIEKYWGNNVQNIAPFNQNSNWYWASAGKTLTAFLVGIAQENGKLNINDKTSDYLGIGWSDITQEKENLITLRHQLTMTTGLDYTVSNPDCTSPECLQYKADAGNQWYYHNAPYTLLETVSSNATGMTYNELTDLFVGSKIGMDGNWISMGDNNVYWSTTRDAARFGLLLLNKGVWSESQVLADHDYFTAMTRSSQTLNPSYGYCTWLNGKSSIIVPGLSVSFNVPLSPVAPPDLFAALGKNGQFIDVAPDNKLVVIRMGEAPDNSLVPITFHDEMWEKINAIIN
jgi:CubicO group peptidase (beta-lactamase class C family)